MVKTRDDLKQLDKKVRKELKWVHDNMDKIRPHLTGVEPGSMNDINDVLRSQYYRWLPALVRTIKPKQIVELGSAGGSSLLMMLAVADPECQIISCTIEEPEGQWRFLDREYPNLIKVLGNDLDLGLYPPEVDLKKTDLWFIDTDHNYDQVHHELKTYDKFFKDGAIVLMDDIRLNDGMEAAWAEIEYPKLSLPDLHWSGYGMFVKA